MPELIQRLKSGHRYIQTKITVRDNIQISAVIARREVDCGIMLNPRPSRELPVRAHARIEVGLVSLWRRVSRFAALRLQRV